ncbi:hypothetical protein LX16_5230 [Stackebrandtia albiflava]|uniref:Uncharacterized protein n=1 Tax=Stackebrandtia albiflava TaxID=406432 RepID=A0A562ULJ7_9ACTN|nr:hypothetical protein [Stackebrandtia albiflava]TWJ06493.1 hypothetical protein LX16_5230 [Stackebrandtia albiflava]
MNSSFGNIGDADTHLTRAEMMFELDRFDEAREELGGALSSDPAHVPSLTLLAVLEMLVGNNEEALTAATAALAAEPTHEPAILARAHALALTRRTDQALRAADEIQQRAPESWWHNVHHALVVFEAKNGQDALDSAWVAVKLAPEEPRAHLTLWAVAGALGLDDLAKRARKTARRLNAAITTVGWPLGPALLRGRPDRPFTAGLVEDAPGAPRRATPTTSLPSGIRRLLRTAGGIGILLPVMVSLWSGGDVSTGRTWAGVATVIAIILLVVMWRRLPPEVATQLRVVADHDQLAGFGIVAAVVAPLLTGAFALTGAVWLLGLAVVAGLAAIGVAQLRR